MLFNIHWLGAAAALVLAAVGPANAAHDASAEMRDRNGQSVGVVMLRQTPYGTLLHARLSNMPPGTHALHVHAIGNCEPPFKLAGPHFFTTSGQQHGLLNKVGAHPGDLPNIHVPTSGSLHVEVLARDINLGDQVFDGDGSSIVIHAGPDDYMTDPAGAAGPRIACGIIHR